jgi:hypothetical protein
MKNALASIAMLLLAGCAADTAQLDAQDDATCRGRGLAPGSEGYQTCRNQLLAGRPAPSRPTYGTGTGRYGY